MNVRQYPNQAKVRIYRRRLASAGNGHWASVRNAWLAAGYACTPANLSDRTSGTQLVG